MGERKISETELADSGNGNGFKFGTYNRGGYLVVGNLEWGNESKEEGEYAKATGFDGNGAENPITLYHNTAWDNEMGFDFQTEGDTLVNNLAIGNDVESRVWTSYPEQYNIFAPSGTQFDFQCTNPSAQNFLMPESDSGAVDAGDNVDSVNWDTAGPVPDIGAVRFDKDTHNNTENQGEISGKGCSR